MQEELFEMANKPKRLAIIKDSDHRYTKQEHFKKVISLIGKFVN